MSKILNFRRMSLSAALLCFGLLVGCATTSIKPADCQSIDWQSQGKKDGAMGYYNHQIARHQKSCPLSQEARKLWEIGRQEGLKSYCTKAHAYALGQRGIELNAVCPEQGLDEILAAHALGFNQYYQRERLNRLSYWYYDPFFVPYNPRWVFP